MIHAPIGPEHGVSLRAVETGDAGFILALRLDPLLSRYIGDTAADAESQRRWISVQRDRAGDYYFICEAGGQAVGTIGLYGIEGGRAEWGRWLIAPRILAAPASALLIYRFAFEILGLDTLVCSTIEENRQVVAFHDRCGLRRTAETASAELRGLRHRLIEHRLDRSDWPEVMSRLVPVAAGAARFLPGARP